MNRIREMIIILLLISQFNCSNKPEETNSQAGQVSNIILINADDLSSASLGSYGQKVIQTPRLDQMAKEGVLFKNGYSAATTCGPSRLSLLLGKHLGHLPYRKNAAEVDRHAICYPQLLQNKGYKTALFGKAINAHHIFGRPIGGFPSHNGFDSFVGTLTDVSAHQYYLDGKTAPQSNHPNHLWKGAHKWWVSKYDIGPSRYTQNEYVDLALDFISENKTHPFFLYLPLQIPHRELVVPKKGELDYQVADNGLLEQYLREDGTSNFQETAYEVNRTYQRPVDMPKATYAAMISRLDRDVGKILDQLSTLGLKENTLVIFTSDNGFADKIPTNDSFNPKGGLRGSKGHLYEGGISVPYIFWGGKFKKNTIEAPIIGYDLATTILDFARVQEGFETDGISWKSALLEGIIPDRKWLYWENYYGATRQAVLIDNRYKVIKSEVDSADYQIALYDIKKDKFEAKDLSENDDYTDVIAFARSVFEREHQPNKDFMIPN